MEALTYITADEAAEILRTSPETLARWRMEGDGPSYFKRRGRVLYTVAGIEGYMAAHEHVASAGPPVAEPAPPLHAGASVELEGLLSADEASAALRASKATLARWRVQGYGPDYVKFGRRVFYTVAALQGFLEGNTRTKTRGEV